MDFGFIQFFITKEHLSKEAIIIDEKDTDKFVSYINKEKIDKVIIDLWNSDIDSISFLQDISHIKYLVIWSNENIDNSPIYELNNLKFLQIIRTSELYIDRVKGLEFFVTDDTNKVINIEHAITLKSIKLIETNRTSVYQNLNFLTNLKYLDTLYLNGLRINSLKGIEQLQNLKVLILIN